MSVHFTPHTGSCQWSDHDLMLELSDIVEQVRKGSRMRALPCLTCNTPIGGAPAQLMFIAMGEICPIDSLHLTGAAMLVHQRCGPPDNDVVIARLVNVAQRCTR